HTRWTRYWSSAWALPIFEDVVAVQVVHQTLKTSRARVTESSSASTSAATGLIVPSTLLTWTNATTLTSPRASSASSWSSVMRPRSVERRVWNMGVSQYAT